MQQFCPASPRADVLKKPAAERAYFTHPIKPVGAAKPAKRRRLGLTALLAWLLPVTAQAAVTAKDIQVAARVLGFTNMPLAGNVKMGIVYDPANAGSKADEKVLLSILGTGLTIDNIKIIPLPIAIANVASTQSDILFLTAGLGVEAGKVGAEAKADKILCITTDLAATRAGRCAVSIQTAPSVQITVNKATASASKIGFDYAFILMVTEI